MVSATNGSARSVVVSTKVRPPSAAAQRAASVATAIGMAGLVGLGKAAAARTGAHGRHSRTGCPARSLTRILEAGGGGEPAQVVVVAEGGRGEDPGLGRTCALLGEHVADVQRRLDQPRLLGRHVDPAHMALGGVPAERRRQLRQAPRRARQSFAKSGPRAMTACSACGRRAAGRGQGVQGGDEGRRAAALGPAQLDGAAQLAQAPRSTASRSSRAARSTAPDKRLPVGQAARLLQAQREQVARKVDQLRRCRAWCRGTARRPRPVDVPRRTPPRRRWAAARPRRCRAAPCRRRTDGG